MNEPAREIFNAFCVDLEVVLCDFGWIGRGVDLADLVEEFLSETTGK